MEVEEEEGGGESNEEEKVRAEMGDVGRGGVVDRDGTTSLNSRRWLAVGGQRDKCTDDIPVGRCDQI